MSKTIIITTDEMKKIINDYMYDKSALTDIYCSHCLGLHDGCPHPGDYPDGDCCPDKTDAEYLDAFVNIIFANYMIPFS